MLKTQSAWARRKNSYWISAVSAASALKLVREIRVIRG